MRFKVKLTWNGETVLQGKCSSVFAYENAKLLASQYVNAANAGLYLPTLESLMNAERGEVFVGGGDDGTGKSTYDIECIR